MAKEKIIHKVRRCKNSNCNEVYMPVKGDSGYCPECKNDWEPEKQKSDNEHYLEQLE